MAFFATPPIMGHRESFLPPIASGGHATQLLTGPALVVVAYAVQVLKKKMTGTHSATELYKHIWKFLGKAEARDKFGRIFQYGCRALQGILAHMDKGFWLQAYKPAIAEMQTNLAWARRTHRWGKEMPHIPALGEAIARGDVLESTQRVILITFLVQDHIYWLLKMGFLKFEQYTPVQWHRRNLRFIITSHVLNFALCVRDIKGIRAKQEKSDPSVSGSAQALMKADQDIKDNQKMMFRYVLTFIQMLHVTQIRKMDDWYIGIMGMMSSAIDASKQW